MMLRNQAYRSFKSALFQRVLSPGQFVSIRELCETLGTSMVPMRDAIGRLEVEGLIESIPKRGIKITALDTTFIKEAFQVRRILEVQACREIVGNMPGDRFEEIHDMTSSVIARASDGISDALLAEAYQVDWKLHNELIRALGNEHLARIHETNSDRIRLTRLNALYTKSRVLPAMREHLKVTEALRKGDGEAAAAAMDAHIRISEKRALGGDATGLV